MIYEFDQSKDMVGYIFTAVHNGLTGSRYWFLFFSSRRATGASRDYTIYPQFADAVLYLSLPYVRTQEIKSISQLIEMDGSGKGVEWLPALSLRGSNTESTVRTTDNNFKPGDFI